MQRRQKLAATIWSTALAAPILYVCIGYAMLECGELDPCPTGGAMPYAGGAIFLAAALTIVHIGFLVMIWRSDRQA